MRNNLFFLLVFFAGLPILSAANQITGTTEIACTVKNIGLSSEDIGQDLELLRLDPHLATKLLVTELHTIPRKVYYENKKTKESRHIISCLRALHYLTGTTFTATSSSSLTDDEKQFLDFKNQMHDDNPGHELHFFGVWMSRNADFVAPIDAQRKIIKQWQQWQYEHGDSFTYSPSNTAKNSMEDWYW